MRFHELMLSCFGFLLCLFWIGLSLHFIFTGSYLLVTIKDYVFVPGIVAVLLWKTIKDIHEELKTSVD